MVTDSTLHTLTLLLYATVPSSRQTQLLHILSGLCSHLPVPIRERHLLFHPVTQAARTIAADEGGGTQNVVDKEKARRRAEREARERGKGKGVVRYVEEVGTEEGDGEDMAMDALEEAGKTKWSMRWYDTPDPNVKGVTARKSENTDASGEVTQTSEAVQAAEKIGLRFQAHYILSGSQFVYNNIVLLLHKPLLPPAANDPSAPLDLSSRDVVDGLKPLDPSGAYVLEARLEILDAPGQLPSNDLLNRGMKEMARFKEMMRGVVDLRAVERMAMNTRIG